MGKYWNEGNHLKTLALSTNLSVSSALRPHQPTISVIDARHGFLVLSIADKQKERDIIF
jgi:hypothetical protein